jgi:hypothetical protein
MRCNLLILFACSLLAQPAQAPSARNKPSPIGAVSPTAATNVETQDVTLPEGTGFRVRLLETLDTRRNRAGDRFTASLDEPLVEGNRVVVPKGATVSGHITESKPSGRWKGRAVIALRLDALRFNGRTYPLRSTYVSRVSAGHKKHHLLWIGGGSSGGALIGAAAGGGAGALIGAGVGAAAGTVGSVITGKRQVRLPVETTVHFRLRAPLTLPS